MANLPTKESFLKDVAEHQMKVMLDDGVYRHIRFQKPSTISMYFELITGPGFLLYRGDMGCYEFERLRDMFEFFRDEKGELRINPYYWSEKLQASDCNGRGRSDGAMEFSMEIFEKRVRESVKDYLENGGIGFVDEEDKLEKETYQERLESFEREVETLLSLDVECEEEAHRRLMDWEFFTDNMDDKVITAEDVFGCDTWEWSLKDYTFRFMWCCYAITWGIQQYDNASRSK